MWKIVERKIGRAGSRKQRIARQKQWDEKYGDWAVGYVIAGEFVDQETAVKSIYFTSYAEHFERNPSDLTELLQLAKILRNPHAEATTGVDLQIPAILNYIQEKNLKLSGKEVVDIGSYDGKCSHPISVRLSPLTIACCIKPRMTLESFWQQKKCLAVFVE